MSITSNAVLHPQLTLNQGSMVFDDFYAYTSGNLWTTAAGSSGTAAADDTGGVDQVLLTTAATLNDYEGVITTKKNFLFANGIAYYSEAYVNYTSQSSNNVSFASGFASAGTIFASSTADPSGSYSGALIYRLSGDTNWRVQSSNGSTKTTSTAANMSCADGYHVLRIDVVARDAANCKVLYSVDNHVLTDINNIIIQHTVAYSALVKMGLFDAVVAAGSNVQTAAVDYHGGGKYRQLLQGFQS